jgi:hypothetical protein
MRLEGPLAEIRGRAQHRLGAPHQPAQHAHAVVEQAAVAGVVDGGLDHRAVEPQLAPGGHLEVAGQRHHPLVERGERRRGDHPGPAQQRRVGRHLLLVDPAELAQRQAAADEMLELLVAPTMEPLDHQQAHDGLDRRAGAPRRQAAA